MSILCDLWPICRRHSFVQAELSMQNENRGVLDLKESLSSVGQFLLEKLITDH